LFYFTQKKAFLTKKKGRFYMEKRLNLDKIRYFVIKQKFPGGVPPKAGGELTYSPQHPASGFQSAFFAKPASLPVYPTKPFGFSGSQKSFNSPHLCILFLSIKEMFYCGLILFLSK